MIEWWWLLITAAFFYVFIFGAYRSGYANGYKKGRANAT